MMMVGGNCLPMLSRHGVGDLYFFWFVQKLVSNVLPFWPFPPEAEADNINWDCAVIVITMFQIQCRNVCEGDGWLLEWWREKTGWSFALGCAGGRTVGSMWWS